MSKIYYNVKQFKNALATGLLGLATLGPMTSCEKEEHGNFNNNGIEMTNSGDEDTNGNSQGQIVDDGEVNDVLYCGLEDFDGEVKYGKDYNIGQYDDGAYIRFKLEYNNGGTTLTLDFPDKVNYRIEFKVDENNNLTPSEISRDSGSRRVSLNDKQNVIKIFSKYRIGEDVYGKFNICPPKYPLELKDDLFINK